MAQKPRLISSFKNRIKFLEFQANQKLYLPIQFYQNWVKFLKEGQPIISTEIQIAFRASIFLKELKVDIIVYVQLQYKLYKQNVL